MLIVVYLGVGIALTVYAWSDVVKPWGAVLAVLGWPLLMLAGLYLTQRDRYEARRNGR